MARSPRRGRGGLAVIYWRDIPAQVKGAREGERVALALPDRFQVAIDAAATRAGVTGDDEYLAEWREVAAPDPSQDPASAVARLTQQYPQVRLTAIVRNGGWEHPRNDLSPPPAVP